MRLLISTAWDNRSFRFLACIMVCSMLLLTLATQMEIFSIGLITRKGPDFFELFAPAKEQGGLTSSQDYISRQQLERRWGELSSDDGLLVTRQAATAFLAKQRQGNLFESAVAFFDRHLQVSGNPSQLAWLLLAVALFKAVTLFAHRYSTRLAAIAISSQLRQRYFEHIQAMPMVFYQQHNVAGLSARVVSDAASVAEAINATMVNYLQTPFTVISTFLLCLATSWQLTLVVFLGFPLIAYPVTFLAKKVKKVSRQLLQNQESFAAVLLDFLSGIQTVKVFAMEEFSRQKYHFQNERMAALERKSARYDLSSRPIIHTIAMFFLAVALLSGLYLLDMSLPEVLVYCGFLYIFYEPIKKFAEENSHIQRGIAAADRMFEVLQQQPQLVDAPDAYAIDRFDGELRFEDVWFRYGEQWVLKGVSFAIKKGEMVALVGPTGAGKSTVAQLIPRLYDVQQGAITIDGRPVTCLQQKALRELIAFVPQRPFLFLDTIHANIAIGKTYTAAQVAEAARRAHADEFIDKLPDKYDTVLQDTGRNLSGGQQQRLAIARALIKQAPILILDEATSSLDALSEKLIKDALQELRGAITQIVIAHRLSTIENADKIIYMEHGQVVAQGTKEELLACCPGFRAMWLSSQLQH